MDFNWINNITAIVAAVVTIGPLLGYLRGYFRKKQLFEALKNLIIEFLELADSEEKRETLARHYKIGISMRMIGGNRIEDLNEYNSCALLLACEAIIQKKYKLTKPQIANITDIIRQMKPSIIENIYINFGQNQGDIVFCAPDEEPVYIDRNQETFINIEKIQKKVEELKNGDWDTTIKTRIKEMG